MVNIKLKRKMSMKNYHKFGMINPSRMYDCLKYWVKNHPDYKDIKVENEEDWRKKCPTFFNDNETSEQDFKMMFHLQMMNQTITRPPKY